MKLYKAKEDSSGQCVTKRASRLRVTIDPSALTDIHIYTANSCPGTYVANRYSETVLHNTKRLIHS